MFIVMIIVILTAYLISIILNDTLKLQKRAILSLQLMEVLKKMHIKANGMEASRSFETS